MRLGSGVTHCASEGSNMDTSGPVDLQNKLPFTPSGTISMNCVTFVYLLNLLM